MMPRVKGLEQAASEFQSALLDLDQIRATEILDQHKSTLPNLELVSRVVVPALERIGDSWQDGSLALSQIYMSGRICEQLIDRLFPPGSEQRKCQPNMAIAVLDDFHFLGKRIIYSHIRSAGYGIADYGRKTADELVARVVADELEIIFISTLMYPSALQVKTVRKQLDQRAPHVKIVVGGAPFNLDHQLWQEVGAHAMCHNGSEAVKYINSVMES
jgi:methanogenic corrinoid protein MtbC1